MKPRPSSAACTWAPAHGGYVGEGRGFEVCRKAITGLKWTRNSPHLRDFYSHSHRGAVASLWQDGRSHQARGARSSHRRAPRSRLPAGQGKETRAACTPRGPSGGRGAPGAGRGMGPREGWRGRGRAGREGETGPRPPAGGRGR